MLIQWNFLHTSFTVGPGQSPTGNLVRWPLILQNFDCLVSNHNSCLLPVFLLLPLYTNVLQIILQLLITYHSEYPISCLHLLLILCQLLE